MYYLSERDRQIQKSINAKVRAMPPVDTWRTSRRTFAAGSAGSTTTAGEAHEDIATGALGKVNLYQGPLSAPELLMDGGGGVGGAFSSAFSSAFDIGTDEHVQIEAWNLTETPIWQGARVIVDKILLKGGQPESMGYVVIEHNSATVIRAIAPTGGVAAGGTGTFTSVIPIDGIYQPTTAEIYSPSGLYGGQVVIAVRNYNSNRWEADPDEGNPAPSGDTVRVIRIFGSAAADCAPIDNIGGFADVWDGVIVSHAGTAWADTIPEQHVWMLAANHCANPTYLSHNERYVAWFIGDRTYNGTTRPAYVAHMPVYGYPPTAMFFGQDTTLSVSDMHINNPLTLAQVQSTDNNLSIAGSTITIATASSYRISWRARARGPSSVSGFKAVQCRFTGRRDLAAGTWTNLADMWTNGVSTSDHFFVENSSDSVESVATFAAGEKVKLVLWDFDDNGLGLTVDADWAIMTTRTG